MLRTLCDLALLQAQGIIPAPAADKKPVRPDRKIKKRPSDEVDGFEDASSSRPSKRPRVHDVEEEDVKPSILKIDLSLEEDVKPVFVKTCSSDEEEEEELVAADIVKVDPSDDEEEPEPEEAGEHVEEARGAKEEVVEKDEDEEKEEEEEDLEQLQVRFRCFFSP